MDLLITPHPPQQMEQIPMKTNRRKTALSMMALAAALASAPLAAAAKPSRTLDYTKTPNRYVDVEGTRAPTRNSVVLYEHIPNAELSLYPDSGHGVLFQHHDLFVSQVATFLDGIR